MAKWAIAIHNEIEGENKVFIVEAEDQRGAVIRAAMDDCENEERAKETEIWLSDIDDYDEVVTALANGELICSDPILLDKSILNPSL